MRKKLRALGVAGLLIAGVLVGAAQRSDANFVTANWWGWTACASTHPCTTNDKSVYTWTGDLGPQMLTATNGGLSSINATNLNVLSAGAAHGIGTDIYYGYQDLPGSALAETRCDIIESGTWKCTHTHIMYDGDALATYTAWQQRYAACHESGHAVGLLHGQDGNPQITNSNTALECLRTPIPASGSGSNILGTHNNAHINFHYP